MTLPYHFCVGVCVCLWHLMDFLQDSDKPIYLKCKMLSVQILFRFCSRVPTPFEQDTR